MTDNTITRGGHSFEVSSGKKDTQTQAFTMYKGDAEALDHIMRFLGTNNRSDAIRTAIRSFAAHCAFLQGSKVV